MSDLLTSKGLTDLLTIFSSVLLKGGNFKYACLCSKVYGIKNTKFIFTILSTQLHVRRSKLGYWNDLLLYIDYMKITRLLAWIGKVTSWDFCTLLPFTQSGDDIFFNIWISTKNTSRSFFYINFIHIHVPFCDTKADFQIRSELFVPNWLWNKSKIILKTPMFGCKLMTDDNGMSNKYLHNESCRYTYYWMVISTRVQSAGRKYLTCNRCFFRKYDIEEIHCGIKQLQNNYTQVM